VTLTYDPMTFDFQHLYCIGGETVKLYKILAKLSNPRSLSHAVTLTFDPWTLNLCGTLRVT